MSIIHKHLDIYYSNDRCQFNYIIGDNAGSVVKSKFVHNPVGLEAVRCAPSVEHQRLAHADDILVAATTLGVDGLVAPRGFPEPTGSGAISSVPRWIFLVLVAEEIPIALVLGCVVSYSAYF